MLNASAVKVVAMIAHPGDAGDQHLELLVVVGEHARHEQEQHERQHEVEERRARVAPEQLALEPQLVEQQRHSASLVSSR